MTERTRNWTFILYPESSGPWFLIEKHLNMLGIPCLVSPLHADDEEHIKPHYHVGLFFNSVKSYNQVLKLVQDEFGTVMCDFECQVVSTVFPILDKASFVRYLVHYGFDNKEQFTELAPIEYITKINYPFDICQYFYLDEVDSNLLDIINHIRALRVYSFAYLCNYYIDKSQFDMFNCCKKYRSFLIDYMKSLRYFEEDFKND